MKDKISGFDGLRVYAITMILACHNGFLANTSGGIGNKIFFSLSGFLVYYSLINMKGIKDVIYYYYKRFLRIVPLFWTVIMIVWRMLPGFFSFSDMDSPNSLILNLLFLNNYGHLWFMQHLMLMYLIAPLLILMHNFIKGALNKLGLSEIISGYINGAFFMGLGVLEKSFLTPDVFSMSGEGTHRQFQIWMFLIGFGSAIIGETLKKVSFINEHDGFFKIVTNIYVFLFILILTISVIPSIHDAGKLMILRSEYLRTILSCIIYVMFVLIGDTFIAKVLDNPIFLKLSELSFGIYIWHFFFLPYFRTGNLFHDFIVNYFVSVCFALFTYLVIEKWAIGLIKNSVNKYIERKNEETVYYCR